MSAELERLAYEAALRALDKQEHLVEELRARTGVVLAASSLSASFLSRGGAFDGAHPNAIVVLSVASFVVSIGAAIYILLPKEGLTFSMQGVAIFESLFEFRDDPGELFRNAIDALDRFWDQNDVTIRRLNNAFSVTTLASGSR